MDGSSALLKAQLGVKMKVAPPINKLFLYFLRVFEHTSPFLLSRKPKIQAFLFQFAACLIKNRIQLFFLILSEGRHAMLVQQALGFGLGAFCHALAIANLP